MTEISIARPQYNTNSAPLIAIDNINMVTVSLSWGSALRGGKDAYIPVAFGESVDVYLVSI